MYKRISVLLIFMALLVSCGRPAKPVAKVAGKWISFEQWQVFEKNHGLSKDTGTENLKTGLDQLVRREIAFERGKRKGLLGTKDWEEQVDKVKRNVLIKNYLLDKYLQGRNEPDAEDIKSVMTENMSQRHIQGVPVRDLAAARSVAEELRKGADIKELFVKHQGEVKNGPRNFELGMAKLNQLPPEIQKNFFTAKPGTVLDPLPLGNDGFLVPVLLELSGPPADAKPDQNTIKMAGSLRFQKAMKKASDELATKYPDSFDNAIMTELLKNERPAESELDKSVGTIGKEKIVYSDLLEAFYSQSQREASPLPRTAEVFQGLFKMLVSERRISQAAEDEGYLKKEAVKAEIWDYTQEMGSMRFTKDYLNEMVVKDEDLRKYYESHKDIFRTPGRINLRYLISANPQAIDNARMMMKKGAPWDAVLKAPGILPTSDNGTLGWKSEEELSNMMNPQLFSAIKKSEVGQMVAGQIGPDRYGAFQVFDRENGGVADFEKAKEDIKKFYIRENGPKLVKDYLDGEGRSGTKVETFPQNLV